MVGFLRKKKSDKVMLGDETALDRKGRVDGSSLLDDNGDPTEDTLYNQKKNAKKNGKGKNGEEGWIAAGVPAEQQLPACDIPVRPDVPSSAWCWVPSEQPVPALKWNEQRLRGQPWIWRLIEPIPPAAAVPGPVWQLSSPGA
ncbi:hypothetical protein PINS_up005689 [Pythium insidiosum]|nr:hypothetical protein PINS_up005689 [Pythium insidiosum]